MKTELVNVTPQMAANWLSMNTNNRQLRRSMVEGLKSAFLRGEYITTHQGIAFSTSGELLDGQHRLTAISELRDGVFPMLVTTGADNDSFSVLDIGVKRTASDSLRMDDRRVVEVARLIANICTNRTFQITPLMLLPIINGIQHAHDRLFAFCPSIAKTWSSAPVRLAAIASMDLGSDEDYVKTIYRAMVHSDFDSMSPVAMSLYRSALDGKIRAANYTDMLARCMVAFNDKKMNLQKVQVRDTTEAVGKIKLLYSGYITAEVTTEKKKAIPTGTAKSVSRTNSNKFIQRSL